MCDCVCDCVCVSECACVCVRVSMLPCLCFSRIQYVLLHLEASHPLLHLYQSLTWCKEVYCPRFYPYVCLSICTGSNANMTMCALVTRNSSKRDECSASSHLISFFCFVSRFLECLVFFSWVLFTTTIWIQLQEVKRSTK